MAPLTIIAQDEPVEPPEPFDPYPDTSDRIIHQFVEVEAKYPGGFDSLRVFVNRNLNYPDSSIMAGEQGRVYLSFVVELDGSLSNITVMRGVSRLIDAEAVRDWLAVCRIGYQGSKVERKCDLYFESP